MDQPSLFTRLGAELLGTFLFFFMGFSALAADANDGASIGTLGIAFAFGLGLFLAITAFGHISGGHFNPAVTTGLAVAGKHKWADVIPYWIAQIAGGFLAVLVTAVVFESNATDILETNPAPYLSDWGALVLEIVATALFVCVILTVLTDKRAPWNGVLAPLSIGLFIFTAATAIGPSSGGSFNPARSLAPIIWNFDGTNVWIYIVGPLAGAVLGGSIWATMILKESPAPAAPAAPAPVAAAVAAPPAPAAEEAAEEPASDEDATA